jgi:catechol 2,3-dioxygenase
MAFDPEEMKQLKRPRGLPFRIGKIGHVVLNVSDVRRSVRFYTEMLGFEVSDVYPDGMVPGGMVFMRCNADHHGVALVGIMPGQSPNKELNHMAFEVGTLDEVLRARDFLRAHKVPIDFEGRRRAGCQIAVEFRDPTGTGWRSTGASIRSAATAARAPRPSGNGRRASTRRSPIPSAARTPRCRLRPCRNDSRRGHSFAGLSITPPARKPPSTARTWPVM